MDITSLVQDERLRDLADRLKTADQESDSPEMAEIRFLAEIVLEIVETLEAI